MTVIGRALLILVFAGAVAGSVYLLVGDSGRSAVLAGRQPGVEGRYAGDRDSGVGQPGFPDHHDRDRRHGDRDAVSFGRGLAGVFRSLVVFAVITAAVTRVRFLRRALGA